MIALLKGEKAVAFKHNSSTQHESTKGPIPNRVFFIEPSLRKSDGIHFTVEGKTLARPTTQWERVESSWELPKPFTALWQAEATARTLALRSDGEQVYRVVDPMGKVAQVYSVKKYLFSFEEGQDSETLEEIPAGFDTPMVSQVLHDERKRGHVFLTPTDPCEVFLKCRHMIAHLHSRILALKHLLYQPFYAHITSDQTLIDNQPHYFLTYVEALEDRRQFLKGLYGGGYDPGKREVADEELYLEERYTEGDYGAVVAKVTRPFPVVQAHVPEGMVVELHLYGFEDDPESPIPAPLHALPKGPDSPPPSWVYADEDGDRFRGEHSGQQ